MDITGDLSNKAFVQELNEVLENFDPNKKHAENDYAFRARLTKFNHQANKHELRSLRQKNVQKTDKSYLNQLAYENGIKDYKPASGNVEQ